MRVLETERWTRTQLGAMRRGEYKAYTFRLPVHLPEITFSIALKSVSGCVCLYVSNCSERPRPRLCQWTLIVHADGERRNSLAVRTDETHFIQGLYHVGLYCVSDASFELGCFSSSVSSAVRPSGPVKSPLESSTISEASTLTPRRSQVPRVANLAPGAKPDAWSGTGRCSCGDEGLLEDALAARLARRPPRHNSTIPPASEVEEAIRRVEEADATGFCTTGDLEYLRERGFPGGISARLPGEKERLRVPHRLQPAGGAGGWGGTKWQSPGELHHQQMCGGTPSSHLEHLFAPLLAHPLANLLDGGNARHILCRKYLTPAQPFAVHVALHNHPPALYS